MCVKSVVCLLFCVHVRLMNWATHASCSGSANALYNGVSGGFMKFNKRAENESETVGAVAALRQSLRWPRLKEEALSLDTAAPLH